MPLLCFAGGYATFHVEYAIMSFDLSVEMRRNPSHWLQWYRTPEGVEYIRDGAPKLVQYSDECKALPKATRLVSHYENYRGVPVAGIAVEIWTYFRFDSGGTFSTCARERTAGASIGIQTSTKAQRNGKYEVSEFGITLTYSDGTVERHPFFFNPASSNVYWLERARYLKVDAVKATCLAAAL